MLKEQEQLHFSDRYAFPEGSRDHRIFVLNHGHSNGNVYEGNKMVQRDFEYWSVTLWNQALLYNENSTRQGVLCRSIVMQLVERRFTDGTSNIEIEIGVLKPKFPNDNLPEIHSTYYTFDSQGNTLKHIDNGYSPSSYFEAIRNQQIDGLLRVDQLPDQIDFLATAQAFIDQAKAGNTDTPKLILPQSA